jgi:hypothetical protein
MLYKSRRFSLVRKQGATHRLVVNHNKNNNKNTNKKKPVCELEQSLGHEHHLDGGRSI